MNKKLYIVAFFLVIIGVIGAAFSAKDFFSKEPIDGDVHIASAEIEHIMVDSQVANVRIIQSASDDIEVEWEGTLLKSALDSGNVSVEEEGTTLWVGTEEDSLFDFVSFGFNFNPLEITIHLPEKQFTSIVVDNDVGNTYVSSVDTERLHVESDVSDVETASVNADLLEVESDVGSIYLKDSNGKLFAKSNVGDITIDIDEIKHDMEIISDVGDIVITTSTIPSNVSFNGNSSVGSVTMFGKDGSFINKQAEYMVQIRNDVGDIDIMAR
ncbi:DUF4097 family beta strand repeat-containing protein [Lentibacillus sp. Marseille-P4043]|uniref:DUF4097 family beta strand repeat-containing protein n=1 Tax=Lentibacillus sp. Marseille-P4043 TaxID=2040293 RepID=UPI00131A4F94|nr:DUF4097 family beta strand repeat-containing protein [Lentibacillus sp. Marseille-P4043]